jgi:hypothetical protein
MTPLSHSLTFSITHSYTGNPLKDALIRAGDVSANSDYSGKAVLSLHEGDHQVSISLERYAGLNQEVAVSRDTTFRAELDQLLADAKFVVKLDNSGLYGATISLDGTSETTSPVGIASFKDLKTDTLYHYKIENNSKYLAEDSMVLHTDTTLRFNYSSGTTTGPGSENGPLLFPNPTDNKILLGGIKEGCAYTVCDMKGRALIRGSLGSSRTIDVSELETGVYLLKAGNRRPIRFIVEE